MTLRPSDLTGSATAGSRPARQARTLRTPSDLAYAGLVMAEDVAALTQVAQRYAIAVPPAMAALIDPSDPSDPIARQFVPTRAELSTSPDERADPIGDDAHSPVRGVVHRYPDRALLKLTPICPVYCRFCFRREMVGPQNSGKIGTGHLDAAALEAAFGYIAATPAIWEVIVTGGDPFGVSARRIAQVTARISAIAHVGVLRWHTRVPIVTPEAITPALVRAVRSFSGTSYVGIHANHPRELTPQACAALARLADAGVVLIGQTVLLKGINDDIETLTALMRGLVAARVMPYYLHHGDLAPGTAHFRTSIAQGQALVDALRGRVSGLCQPSYVIDIPGGFGKTVVTAQTVAMANAGGSTMLTDWQGGQHVYPPKSDME